MPSLIPKSCAPWCVTNRASGARDRHGRAAAARPRLNPAPSDGASTRFWPRRVRLTFYQALHENAQFALKINPDAPWPFGKEIRAQCGGVRGLAAAMEGAADEAADIAATVLQGRERFGGCDAFPYSEIMRAVVRYEPRKRRS
ncbi:MAG: hypothetical protein M1449_13845 [Candidatus Thermoplasmatota archaeon]|nr:hypothetical protein [Candidatus Thermoplasmatota archaeon]